MEWKIYTKGGDKGTTSLVGGERVEKHHVRLDAYGTLDELNAHLGMLISMTVVGRDLNQKIQHLLFEMGSYLATAQPEGRLLLSELKDEHITMLEEAIDEYQKHLIPLSNFILPGGSVAISQAHICRTVCRRTERLINQLQSSVVCDPLVLIFINRLSDYFFVLARLIAQDEGCEEIKWKKVGE